MVIGERDGGTSEDARPHGTAAAEPPSTAVGLRQRKKARTRAAIQRCAMRLFRDHGYDATTVEEIAEAAEVSPSTFFRYFPTKEDVVLRDDYDRLMLETFLAQPPEVSPLDAFREAIHVLDRATRDMPRAESELEQVRMALTFSVPAVRARWLDEFMRSFRLISAAVAARAGRTPDDLRVRTFAGAAMGMMMAVMDPATTGQDLSWPDLFASIQQAINLLEQGLPL